MTRFLKGSALIACLLSSFAMTAIAADSEYVRGDLYQEIIRKKALNKTEANEANEANAVEFEICRATAYCNDQNKLGKIYNLGVLLNKDVELQSMRKTLISRHRWTSNEWDKKIQPTN